MRLTRQQRRLTGPKLPLGASLAYQKLLREFMASYHAAIEDILIDGWERNPVPFSGRIEPRQDASTYVNRRLGAIKIQLEQKFSAGTIAKDIGTVAERVNKKGKTELVRVIGIAPRSIVGVGALLNTFRDKNVDLITSLQGQELADITSLLDQAERGAWRVETLRTEIRKQFSVTESKADLLARDQVLKLNGKITETRQTSAGVTQYIWTTSRDERVRPMHEELEGTVQAWASPPIVSEDGRQEHPGGDFQCRCTAFPLIPELDGTGEPG